MQTTSSFTQRVVLLGAGRVGTAVSHLLRQAGAEIVGVVSRTQASADHAAARLGAPVTTVSSLPAADVYLIGATDPGISGFATSIAGAVPEGSFVVHLSGSHGVGILGPALKGDVEGAALHPVQSCPDVDTAIARLPGSRWGVTTTPAAREFGRSFVSAARGVPVEVDEDARPLWHAASVMTSNGLSALLALAERMLEVVTDEDPMPILGSLARGSLDNALEGGGGTATLTGPLVRGEADAIRRHLEAIDRAAPELRPAYVAVAGVILSEALRSGRMDASTEAEIRGVLG